MILIVNKIQQATGFQERQVLWTGEQNFLYMACTDQI